MTDDQFSQATNWDFPVPIKYGPGRLAEVGAHAELLQRGGLYSHLHQMQFRDADGA